MCDAMIFPASDFHGPPQLIAVHISGKQEGHKGGPVTVLRPVSVRRLFDRPGSPRWAHGLWRYDIGAFLHGSYRAKKDNKVPIAIAGAYGIESR